MCPCGRYAACGFGCSEATIAVLRTQNAMSRTLDIMLAELQRDYQRDRDEDERGDHR